jgi:hypothetical protein
LLTVTVCAGLVNPTVTEPKLTTAGLAIIDPAEIPFPVSGTTAGVTPAESVLMVNVPVRIPIVDGVNPTPVVQLAPAAKVAGHAFPLMLKSPEAETRNPASDAPPEFVNVNVCVVAAVLTTTLPNVIWVGLDEIPPTAVPLPSSETTSGVTPRLLTVAVNAPG